MTPLPLWRKVAGAAVLGALVFFLSVFTPIYFHNFQLREYVENLTRSAEKRHEPDALLRTQVVDKAHQLNLQSVTADNVQVSREGDGVRIEVRYHVLVSFPGYTVQLHFYPGAGSR